MNKHCFASDNYSGVTPEAWRALEVANAGSADPYGDDEWTLKAAKKFPSKIFLTRQKSC